MSLPIPIAVMAAVPVIVTSLPMTLVVVAELLERSRWRRVAWCVDTRLAILPSLFLVYASKIALVDGIGLIPLVQFTLQQAQVLSIALERRIRQVTNERHQTDGKVQCDVDQHAELHAVLQPALDLHTLLEDQQSEEDTDCVTDGGDQSDDRLPAEADTEKFEEAAVEAVGAATDGC